MHGTVVNTTPYEPEESSIFDNERFRYAIGFVAAIPLTLLQYGPLFYAYLDGYREGILALSR